MVCLGSEYSRISLLVRKRKSRRCDEKLWSHGSPDKAEEENDGGGDGKVKALLIWKEAQS